MKFIQLENGTLLNPSYVIRAYKGDSYCRVITTVDSINITEHDFELLRNCL